MRSLSKFYSLPLKSHVSILGLHLNSAQLGAVVPYHHKVHLVGSEGFRYAIERSHLEAYFSLRVRVSLPISTCRRSIVLL